MTRAWNAVRRVLVPVDFSASARPIVEYARGIAKDRGASVTLLHVGGSPSPAAEKDLETLAALVREAGVPVDSRLVPGTAARVILVTAREIGADLVVIGTHGRTGLRQVLLGSVAEDVVRYCPCPVVTLRLPGFENEKP